MQLSHNFKKSIEWNGICQKKSQMKNSINSLKKMRLKWAKEKLLWDVSNWMKVIFSEKSRIWISRDNIAGTFIYYCLKKTSKFLKSFMIWDCTSFKELGEIAIITSTISHECILKSRRIFSFSQSKYGMVIKKLFFGTIMQFDTKPRGLKLSS